MPFESMVAVVFVIAAFSLFGATLAWLTWYSAPRH